MPQSYDDWVCGQFRDVEKEKREMEEGEMEKISREKYDMYMMGDSPVVDILDKVDELIDWINEHEKHSQKR